MKPRSKKTIDAIDYMRRNPQATPKEVAKRYKITLAYVYKLLKEARALGPFEQEVLVTATAEIPTPKFEPPTATSAEEMATYFAANRFRLNAKLAQSIKRALVDHADDHGKVLPDHVWESLDLISTRMAGIVNGEYPRLSAWRYIADHATMVAETIQSDIARELTAAEPKTAELPELSF